MINELMSFGDVALMFLFAASIPIIAIAAELSKRTPSSLAHSIIRSILCIGAIVFISIIMTPGYKATVYQFVSIGFIFLVSLIQGYVEMTGSKISDIFSKFIHKRS